MNISFSLTTPQFKNRTKTVTRRLGWARLKGGEILEACEKCQGLKLGEHPVKLGKIRVESVRREPLSLMVDNLDYGFKETTLEGFPEGHEKHWPSQFLQMFCLHNKCNASTIITRIEFSYL